MNIVGTSLPGVVIIEPQVFKDPRGFFIEQWHQERYVELGLPSHFVQDNLSFSHMNVLRGLHFQTLNPQAKLISVIAGKIYDVAVDVRTNSPTFRRWVGIDLSSENRRQVFIPEGFAHGFCVVSQEASVLYKCTSLYQPNSEKSVAWNDPELAISWPVSNPILSEKDAKAPCLRDLLENSKLPTLRRAA